MEPSVVVTGSSGLVGRELVARLLERGYRVRAWQRVHVEQSHPRLDSARFVLGESSPAELDGALSGVDALVHCAWDFEPSSWEAIERANVQGSTTLFDAARRAGVTKLVFVSSVAAYPGCETLYGKAKLAVEAFVRELGGVSIRPGLVHGDPNAGVYGRLWKSTRARWVPLVDGGRRKFLLIHKQDLATAIERVLVDYERWNGRVLTIGHPDLVSLRALLDRMARAQNRQVTFVPVPGNVMYLGLRTVETLGVRLRFRSDSLKNLLGPDPVVSRQDLDELGVPLRSIDEALGAQSS
jgi:nucleoside-diphosphate-sugar epimerase